VYKKQSIDTEAATVLQASLGVGRSFSVIARDLDDSPCRHLADWCHSLLYFLGYIRVLR